MYQIRVDPSVDWAGGAQNVPATFGSRCQRPTRGAAGITWAGQRGSPSAAFGTSVRPEVGGWNVQLPGPNRRLCSRSFVRFACVARLRLVGHSVLAGHCRDGSVPRRPAPGLALASCPPWRPVSGAALTIISTARTALVFFLELYWAREFGTPLSSAPRFAILAMAPNALHFTKRLYSWMPFLSVVEYL